MRKSKRLQDALRAHTFAPVKVFAIGTDAKGEPVAIPMRANCDGGLVSEPLDKEASIVGLLADGRFVNLPG
jgi:hypothetical protein